MQEIKFRGLRLDNGEWVYGYYYRRRTWNEESGQEAYILTIGEDKSFEVNPETVGQYTGLNGIYEGDIVEIEIRDEDSCMGSTFIEKYVVEWDSQKHRFCYSDNKYHVMGSFSGKWGLDYPNEMAEKINIIGNIYENPELLGGKK